MPKTGPKAEQQTGPKTGSRGGSDQTLHLDLFIPYRLSVLSNVISHTVASIYGERFGLAIPEWRVMAVLGLAMHDGTPMCANAVAQRTEMDKVQVSRAVSRLLSMGLVARSVDKTDRRKANLTLTEEGRSVYRQIVPLAQQYESELLESLGTDDLIMLERLIDRLTKAARGLSHSFVAAHTSPQKAE